MNTTRLGGEIDNFEPWPSLVVDMTKRRPTAKGPGTYRLLDGRTVDLRGLTARERAFLTDLRKMVRADISYFEIERVALGPGSPALGGRNRVDERIVEMPIYLAAEDIATRAGIEQGLLLAPEHEPKREDVPPERSMISVIQAAQLIGVSRTAIYKAIERGTLRATRVGNVTVVDRTSAVTYREHRSAANGRREGAGAAHVNGPIGQHRANA